MLPFAKTTQKTVDMDIYKYENSSTIGFLLHAVMKLAEFSDFLTETGVPG